MSSLIGINAVASSGVALPLPIATGMQSSLPILQKNYKFTKVFFWGKLMGMSGDYLIAKGIEESYETMKFFFCQDGVTWSQLPVVTEEIKANVAKVTTYGMMLTGDISAKLTYAPEVPEGEEPPEEAAAIEVTELERLAVMVSTIESECAMCPAAAVMKKADHTVVGAPTFMGLSNEAASALESYVFLNKPKPVDVNASALKQSTDFLTSCAEMVPKGALTKTFDCSNNVVQWRSLLYPGFISYSVVGMPVHGYCYFGNGLKNTDIAFMLP